MWIFGYGSLIWKADFPYVQRVPGFIHGFVRRFWQGSHDHRGTTTDPGRVVTLVSFAELAELERSHHWEGGLMDDPLAAAEEPDEDGRDVCWGVAYEIAATDEEAVKSHLDHREKNGYTTAHVDVWQHHKPEPVVRGALVYIGTAQNMAFLGPASIAEIANQILKSSGSSGPNIDYLLNLANSLRRLAPDARDPHLFALEKRVRLLMAATSDAARGLEQAGELRPALSALSASPG